MDYEQLPITVKIKEQEITVTVKEARILMREMLTSIDKLKVKCTGCRCYIFPGTECICCRGLNIDPEDY